MIVFNNRVEDSVLAKVRTSTRKQLKSITEIDLRLFVRRKIGIVINRQTIRWHVAEAIKNRIDKVSTKD